MFRRLVPYVWRLWHCHGSEQNIVSSALFRLPLPLCNLNFHLAYIVDPSEFSRVTVRQSNRLFTFVLIILFRGDMFLSYLDIRNNFQRLRKTTSINNVFPTNSAKVIKIPYDIVSWKHVMFSLFCLQWYKVVSFFLLLNNQISRAGKLLPFHTWVDSHSDLFTQWVKKKKKSLQTHKPVFVFWRKTNYFFFPWKGKKKEKEKKKKKKETIANNCFVIHDCMLFAVVVIIQLYVVSLVSSCLCILRVSFCLFLLWLF